MSEIEHIQEINAKKLGDEALSEVKNIPGIFEAITQDGIGDNVDRFDALIPFSDMARLYGETYIEWSESFNSVKGGFISFNEWLQEKARTIIERFRKVIVVNSYVEESHIVFSEIHCPKINGCIAHHIQKTENVHDHYLELKILGFGGGSGKSVKLGTGYEIPAREECRQILKPVKVLIEDCDYQGTIFQRVSILEIKGGYDTRVIQPPLFDQCNLPIPTITSDSEWVSSHFDSPYPGDPAKVECMIEIGDQWSHSMAVELGPFSVGLKVSTSALKTMKYEYKLFGPQKYYGYRRPRTMGYYWTY